MESRQFLCIDYKGPETWDIPRDEWGNLAYGSATILFDEEDAARAFCKQEWVASGCEGDPAKKSREVAVMHPATGKRWVVTVTAEYEVVWTGRAKEVV